MNSLLFILFIVFLVLYLKSNSKLKLYQSNLKSFEVLVTKLKSEIQDLKRTIDYKKENDPYYQNSIKDKRSNSSIKVSIDDLNNFEFKKINREFLYPKKNIEYKSHFFYGKKVVITGDFKNFPSRNEMAKLLWDVGADVDTGIGKYTDVVIVGDNPGSSKMIQAEDLGSEFITENEFLKFFPSDSN